jgi:hypothetical protein
MPCCTQCLTDFFAKEQKLEDINGITRSRKSKKDKQINRQNKKEKAKISDPQNTRNLE